MFPLDIVTFLRTAFLGKTSVGCFWQSYHSTVKSTRVFLIWFHAFTWLRTWLKIYAKLSTNNSLLPRDKTNSFWLELIYHVLSISEYVLVDRDPYYRFLANIYMLEVYNRGNKIKCEICKIDYKDIRRWSMTSIWCLYY